MTHPGSVPAFALALALVAGCGGEPPPKAPLGVTAAELSVEGLEVAPTGELAGKPFTARAAQYLVVRYPDRHRLDLYFDDPAPDDCGLPLPRDTRRVWLRFDGAQTLEPGELVLEADAEDPPFSVHYERLVDGNWVGQMGGVARVAIDEVSDRLLVGRLNVCFDDGQRSCVKGAFRAAECFRRIDGRQIREGVGLLEPVPEER